MEHDTQIAVAKGASAWLAVGLSRIGIHQWSDVAAMCAAGYSLLLIGEWVWKHWKRWNRP